MKPHGPMWEWRFAGVVLAALALAACAGPTPKASTTAPPSTVAPALPAGVLASIVLPKGGNPTAVTAAFGSVWVGTHHSTLVYRIDPATNRLVATIDLNQVACGSLDAGFGRLWAGHCGGQNKTVVIDPTTNQVVGTFVAGGLSRAFDQNSVWTGSEPDSRLIRVDPATYQTTATLDAKGVAVVAGGGFIWSADVDPVSGDFGGTIWKVDPTTNAIAATIHAPPASGSYPSLVFVNGALVVAETDGTLLRIDPATGAVAKGAIPGFTPLSQLFYVAPVTDGTTLWVRTGDGGMAQLDPMTFQLGPAYPADPKGGGGGLASGYGSLWVANYASDTVWRIRLAG